MKNYLPLFITLFLISTGVQGQIGSAEEEKKYFDFLLGDWRIEKKVDRGQVGDISNDSYTFKKTLDGHAITSEWYFNRGSIDKPEYVNALYFSAYDTRSKTWTFYYISNLSAQFWEGKKENGVWNFYKEFNIEGQPSFIQRQTWISKDKDTFVRSINNSYDKGATWQELFNGVFKRK